MDEKLVLYQQLQKAKRDEIARRIEAHRGKIAREKARMTRARALVPYSTRDVSTRRFVV
jgi:hypothetical protein